MSTDRTADDAACRHVVSSSGLCGVTLGVVGEHAGVLYDFFASPYEDIRAVYALMELALEQGAHKLAIWESTFLAGFFEQFGFEAVCIMSRRGAPPNWIPEACRSELHPMECPDFVFMARKIYETSPGVSAWMSRARELPRSSSPLDGRQRPCANCGAHVESDDYFELFGGYHCRCGFIYVCGTLTTGIPRFTESLAPCPSLP